MACWVLPSPSPELPAVWPAGSPVYPASSYQCPVFQCPVYLAGSRQGLTAGSYQCSAYQCPVCLAAGRSLAAGSHQCPVYLAGSYRCPAVGNCWCPAFPYLTCLGVIRPGHYFPPCPACLAGSRWCLAGSRPCLAFRHAGGTSARLCSTRSLPVAQGLFRCF